MLKKYKFLVLEKKVNFSFISSCYKKIDSYGLDDYLIIYKLYKEYLKDFLDNSNLPKIKSMQDIYNLDDPEKILIEKVMKKVFEDSIENILVPCLNINFLNSKIDIDGCGTFVYDKKLFIISNENIYSSFTKKKVCSYLLLDLLNRFLL